jgi:hypothetical protein
LFTILQPNAVAEAVWEGVGVRDDVMLGVRDTDGVAPRDREAVGEGEALAAGHVISRSLLLDVSATTNAPLALGADTP